MRTRLGMLFIAASALPSFLALPATAQQCQLSDTPTECWLRFNPAPPPVKQAADAQAKAAQKSVATENTGISNLTSPSASALKDFLSLLSGSLESSSLSQNGKALTFDWNPPFEILGADHALKLQAVFADAKLNAQMIANLNGNAAAQKSFEDSLASFDDVTLSATFQPTSQSWGRSIKPYRDYFETMFADVLPSQAKSDDEFEKTRISLHIDSSLMNTSFNAMSDLSAAKQSQALKLFESGARTFAQQTTAVAAFTRAFAKLLNNQPQLYGSAAYQARKNIVGPNEWTYKSTYEWAPANLSAFRRDHKECSDLSGRDRAAIEACTKELEKFAPEDNASADRVAFSAEYHRVNRRWIKETDPAFEFGYARVNAIVGSFTYGRTVGGVLTAENGRFDFTVKYEHPNGSDSISTAQKGTIGSITYTQKINGSVSIPVSLIYSDHQSGLSNANRKLNAHFGLIYKLPTK